MKDELLKNLDKIIEELKKGNDINLKANKDTVKILSFHVKKIN